MADPENDAGSLEETIHSITPDRNLWGVDSDGTPAVHDLEKYVADFTKRYTDEAPFRDIVHDYLGVSPFSRATLSLGKTLMRSWYKSRTDKMIRDYAVRIRKDLTSALQLRNELIALQEAERKLHDDASGVRTTASDAQDAAEEYRRIQAEHTDALARAQQEYASLVSGAEAQTEEQRKAIIAQTDAVAIVRAKLQDHMQKLALFRVNESGQLEFDEKHLVRKLEDMFLDEIVNGIARQGDIGFLTKTKRTYDGVMAYWAEIDDLEELPDVDWVESAIHARSRGQRLPCYPYLIAGKPRQNYARSSLETAIALDTSGSMEERGRFDAAKKSVLATHALLRRLNPRNNTYLAHYSTQVNPISTAQLYKMKAPDGGTATHLAINWLISTLGGSDLPGLAYLVTDGAPDDVDACVAAAKSFQQHPELLLRIFLIDGNKDTAAAIRKIGNAAGPTTKIIPVDSHGLQSGVIKDISQAIGQMHTLAEF